jgi:hypothetical protein
MIPARNQLACGCFALAALLSGDWAAWPIMNASGQVRDAAGRAVPRARVTVQSVDGERRYASTTTDGEGRFAMAIGGIDVREVELLVEADRFALGGGRTSPAHLECLAITLHHVVDQAFLDRLLAEQDPAVRREAIAELLSLDLDEDHLPVVFPYLGRLRADLRAAVAGAEPGALVAKDRRDQTRTELRESAKSLLALWGDPQDRDLTAARPEHPAALEDAPPGVIGATPAAVCAAWTEVHFRAEKVKKPWTWHRCDPPVLDPAGTRAMMKFEVRYAHWEYDLLLFLVHEGQVWRLRSVMQWRIT